MFVLQFANTQEQVVNMTPSPPLEEGDAQSSVVQRLDTEWVVTQTTCCHLSATLRDKHKLAIYNYTEADGNTFGINTTGCI